MRRSILAVAILVVVACTGDESSPTTTVAGSGNTLPSGGEGTTSSTSPGEATETTLAGRAVDTYRIAKSEETLNGLEVHLVIPRAGYTDVDLENFIRDFRDATPGLWGAQIFDSDEAQAAYLVAEALRTEEQRTLITRHHLLTLDQGETLIWRGPFSSLGQSIIGS